MSGFSLSRLLNPHERDGGAAGGAGAPSAGAQVFDHTADWAQAQVLPWAAAVDLSRADYDAGVERIHATRHDMLIYDVADGAVTLREPQRHHPTEFNRRIEAFRAGLYLELLNNAVRMVGLDARFAVVVGVADKVFDVDPRMPVFGYQRLKGERPMLLPDIEFQEHHFYEREHADLHPDEKVNQIVFSGASTGKWLSDEDVATDASERLSFAAHFVGHPQVKFSIGMAAECSTPEAEAMLRAKPYFHEVNWHDQMRSRFIFSMDGNGATCSRVLRGLKTRSVLLKLKSENELYYFSGLIPWRHYIPIEDMADLDRLAPQITREDFPSDAIADAANAFCAQHLTREKVTLYTGRLLRDFHTFVHARLA